MIVRLKDVIYQIPNGHIVYENLNFELYLGEFIGVLGKNGAGKTTLLDLLMGYRPISKGEISVLNEDPMSSTRRYKDDIFVLSHDIQIQSSHSVRNYLEFTSFFYKNYDLNKEKELLEYFGINPNVKMGSLSTGQKVKAQIVAAISAKPRLYLMDEVTAVLDPESRKQFFVLLKKLHAQKDCCMIMATNIAEDLNGVVDKVLFIDHKHADVHDVSEIKHLFNLDLHEDEGEAA
ncbi:MAG: ABC transporter ATP-binding protein [Flavobacteriia bacterium]|jgi:ABC-2 type transport system ATP-binding protein|nr:ABC transporter ATP-binding protein [Flavobacteriia bacterium]